MSDSDEFTLTANYGLKKPIENADDDVWGTHVNEDLDSIDNLLFTNFADVRATFLRKTGDTLTGGGTIDGVPTPIAAGQITPKSYVDGAVAGLGATVGAQFLRLTGGALTSGTVSNIPIPTGPTDAAPKNYVDSLAAAVGNTVGTWNATSNTPTVTSGSGAAVGNVVGNALIVDTAGATVIDGKGPWFIGDLLLWTGTVWARVAYGAVYAMASNGTLTGSTIIAAKSIGWAGGETIGTLDPRFPDIVWALQDAAGNIGATIDASGKLTWAVMQVTALSAASFSATALAVTSLTIGADVWTVPNPLASPSLRYALQDTAGNIIAAVYDDGVWRTAVSASNAATVANAPAAALDVVNKAYFDAHALTTAGGTMVGPLFLFRDPLSPTEAATKNYVDSHAGGGGGSGKLVAEACIGAGNVSGPGNEAGDDTVSDSLNARSIKWAPLDSPISDIVLSFYGYIISPHDTDWPQPYTVKASVEYPIGSTPRRVYWNGADSIVVNPGRIIVKSDPLPVAIPAGAQYAVKCFCSWTPNHWYGTTNVSSSFPGEWTQRGVGLADHSLDNLVQTSSAGNVGFPITVFARLRNNIPIIGAVGDSILWSQMDWCEPVFGIAGWQRAMRGRTPWVNLGRNSDQLTSMLAERPEDRHLILRDAITHLFCEGGTNDLFNVGSSAVQIRDMVQRTVAPYLDRGVKCYACTFAPWSDSTDNWTTTVNQTMHAPAIEPVRQTYNADLRANFASWGLTGVLDIAHVIDATDSGVWSCDVGGSRTTTGVSAAAFPTLSAGAIASAAYGTSGGLISQGGGYPVSSTIPCSVYTYPFTSGSGGAVHGVSNATGNVTAYVVDTPGAGYTYPPMINVLGAWTDDGRHPNKRGFNELIYRLGLGPEYFPV